MKVAYHQVDRSESLNNFVEDKMNNLASFKDKISNVNWMISKEGSLYKSVIHFKAYGKQFNIEGHGENGYASVLKVLRKVKSSFSKRVKMKQKLHRKVQLSF